MVVPERQIVITPMQTTQVKMQSTEHPIEICDEAVGLLMTYRCNLNCRYCYVHKKRSKDMTLEMAQKIIEPFLNKVGLLSGFAHKQMAQNPLQEYLRHFQYPLQY